MKPITFACQATLPQAPAEIARQILDMANWPEFSGYGPIPGIKAAEFEVQTPDVVGSRIRVTNLDGSSHVEEIVEWDLNLRLRLRMSDFSPPLSCLATGFDETWEFERDHGETRVTRSLEMTAASIATRPILWAISFFLRRAIARHLQQIGSPSIAVDRFHE